MSMSSITVRVDDDVKTQAAAIADYFGFDLSSVTRAFYKQMIREQRIPLNLAYPEPNSESLKSMREADAILTKGIKCARFKNADELFEDLDI